MLLKLAPRGEITPDISYSCFPFLFRALIMMRSIGDTITRFSREQVIIGKEIPPIRVMILEVRYTRREQDEHNRFYREIIKEISKVNKEQLLESEPSLLDEGEGRQNIGVLCYLCLLGFSLFLNNYLLGASAQQTISTEIRKIMGVKDYGFTAFFELTRSNTAMLRPPDAISQIH
jgi:hypothetical protein